MRATFRPSGPRRRGRVAALLAAGVLVAVAPSCSSDEGTKASDGGTEVGEAATVEATTGVPATTASTTPAEVTTTVPPAPTGSASPEEAAQRLYDTWKAGDRASAALVAEPVAIEGVFATAPGDYGVYSGCDSAEFDTSGCLFRGDSGTIQFTMEQRESGWVVIECIYSEPGSEVGG